MPATGFPELVFSAIQRLCKHQRSLKQCENFPPSYLYAHTDKASNFRHAGKSFGCNLHQNKVISVEENGLEPITFCLQSRCTANCATPPKFLFPELESNQRPTD